MLERTKFVVATGRFQTIHLGSLAYLIAAMNLAAEAKAQFRVLSGPLDSELALHGTKEVHAPQRRLLLFSERQFLLSLMLSIPAAHILNNESSPHHGEPGLSRWASSFFDQLLYSERDFAETATEGRTVLAVVIKGSDIKVYRPGDNNRHYSEYLKEIYPWLTVTDLRERIGANQDTHLPPAYPLSSGAISCAMSTNKEWCHDTREPQRLVA